MDVTLIPSQNQADFFCRRERCATYRHSATTSGFVSLRLPDESSLTEPDTFSSMALWVEHGNVNGFSFSAKNRDSRTAGEIRCAQFIARRGSQSSGFQHELLWQSPDGETLLEEERTVRIEPGPCQGSVIDLTILLRNPTDNPITLGKTLESFVRLRVAPSLRPEGGGLIRNSFGDYAPNGLEGRSAKWCSAVGVVKGATMGIVFLEHPRNPWNPSPWSLSPAGVLSPTPFPWREHTLKTKETLKLSYRIMLHQGYVDAGWATERLAEFTQYAY